MARWAFEHGAAAGRGTDTLPGRAGPSACRCVRSATRSACWRSRRGARSRARRASSATLLEALRAPGGARARARAARRRGARASALRAQTEEMRSSLLSRGVARPAHAARGDHRRGDDAARRRGARSTPTQRDELLDTIVEEAERLERLVANLLDMTRLESGGRRAAARVGPARGDRRRGARRGSRRVLERTRRCRLDLPEDLPLVAVDPVLFEQVAAQPARERGQVHAARLADRASRRAREGDASCSRWRTAGPGFAPGDEARVFEKFYRGGTRRCRGRPRARHLRRRSSRRTAARIGVENRTGGGALVSARRCRVDAAVRTERRRRRGTPEAARA